ncbi:hypothetical protein [Azohydromonas lata]|uniref:Uncharacterized protein n=1 Tax=Azohydromonas lata TaxID=45677 RepID=A0ABU5IAU3_9BURK|nr:hypothetical protein [Azohydromonas lata]MDZ5455660.1 hypothetical protein [Azohydromonas lata]
MKLNPPTNQGLIVADVVICDESNAVVASGSEISAFPTKSLKIDKSSNMVKQASQLAMDLLNGAISVPGKTIEIAFKKEVQDGLRDGVYTMMRTKEGEVLADAVNKAGIIVGKGRVVEAGKFRQLAAGAFQLVSIAVAQSHLADIEKSLATIKGGISRLADKLEAADRSNLSGSISYLEGIVAFMKNLKGPEEVPTNMKYVVESISRDAYVFRDKLFEDADSLIKEINNQADIDSFGGTENTFNAIMSHAEALQPLLARHELVIHLFGLINFIVSYLDPLGKEFSRPKLDGEMWRARMQRYSEALNEKAKEHLTSAVLNSDSTLKLRRQSIQLRQVVHLKAAYQQQSAHEDMISRIEKQAGTLLGRNSMIKVAISFDQAGKVKEAALLPRLVE